ncbi:hypothetical protein K432DRAFT_444527 [Lepidopterella palustris CBS 459.81]|uniref:Uncharacterized protein n=1 Tax=Lepidopterella palustris CBS 459.81 TaxID=1314670 RepID=A0A8E2JDG9_9PEZI|nr:hypothetical protein K432DRAFT_444527 [Lepidopterella palustris CBS 459.81]
MYPSYKRTRGIGIHRHPDYPLRANSSAHFQRSPDNGMRLPPHSLWNTRYGRTGVVRNQTSMQRLGDTSFARQGDSLPLTSIASPSTPETQSISLPSSPTVSTAPTLVPDSPPTPKSWQWGQDSLPPIPRKSNGRDLVSSQRAGATTSPMSTIDGAGGRQPDRAISPWQYSEMVTFNEYVIRNGRASREGSPTRTQGSPVKSIGPAAIENKAQIPVQPAAPVCPECKQALSGNYMDESLSCANQVCMTCNRFKPNRITALEEHASSDSSLTVLPSRHSYRFLPSGRTTRDRNSPMPPINTEIPDHPTQGSILSFRSRGLYSKATAGHRGSFLAVMEEQKSGNGESIKTQSSGQEATNSDRTLGSGGSNFSRSGSDRMLNNGSTCGVRRTKAAGEASSAPLRVNTHLSDDCSSSSAAAPLRASSPSLRNDTSFGTRSLPVQYPIQWPFQNGSPSESLSSSSTHSSDTTMEYPAAFRTLQEHQAAGPPLRATDERWRFLARQFDSLVLRWVDRVRGRARGKGKWK